MKILTHPYRIFDIRIIDSDTLEAWVEIDRETRHLWRLRLKGVEGGELGEPEGMKGVQVLSTILMEYDHNTKWFFGNPNAKDKYGRHVGDIEFGNGTKLCALLLLSGHHWRRDRDGTEHKPTTSNEGK